MEDQAASSASTSQPNVFTTNISIVANNSKVIAPSVIGSNISDSLNINSVNQAAKNQQVQSFSDGASSKVDWDLVRNVQQKLKLSLKTKLKNILDSVAEKSSVMAHDLILPLHCISDEEEEGTEHEIWRIEEASLNETPQEKTLNANNIFKPLPETDKPVKTVLTKGIAGIGKTVSVQKFVFDWAEGRANQDVHFMFLLPFWELELVKEDDDLSLDGLLCRFYPELKDLNMKVYEECKVVFILDGLDENRGFYKSEKLFNEAQPSSVGLLISDLLSKKLLPSAHIWITSRPAAAKQFTGFDRVTEIRGFGDLEKDEYFRKRVSDPDKADRIILHVKSSRNLYVMCRIPFFCSITALVLERMIDERFSGELPKTVTEIYTCFLFNTADDLGEDGPKRLSDSDQQTVVALGELAFKHLRDNILITEGDLSNHGIAVDEEAKQVLTLILREEKPMRPCSKRYRFLHSGVQEFLAALYVLNSYTCWGIQKFHPVPKSQLPCDSAESQSDEFDVALQQLNSLHDLLRAALDKALAFRDGHLDLLLRFLLGLSLNYTHNSLSELIGHSEQSQENIQRTIRYIKYMLKKNGFTHAKCVNLLCCLAELKDSSFEEEMMKLLSSRGSAEGLSFAQCSVLAHLVQVSGSVHEELDVVKLCKFNEGQKRLFSVLQYFKKALLARCWIVHLLEPLVSALLAPDSQLRELDLSHIIMNPAQIDPLSVALWGSRLESLNLSHINLSSLPGAGNNTDVFLGRISLPLVFLNSLKKTTTGVSVETCGARILKVFLSGPQVRIRSLKLKDCSLSYEICEVLASALQSNTSVLRELDLSYNFLTDTGVQNIFQKLRHPNCVLELLRLTGCGITGDSCRTLNAVLPRTCLKELYLGHNRIGDNGLKLLGAALQKKPILHTLELSYCNLTADGCEALASALSLDSSAFKELDLSNNDLGDAGVKLISAGMKSPHCKLEVLRLSGCMITEEGCSFLASALQSNPSHLRELDLSYNNPGESGQMFSGLLEDSHCKLETVNLNNGGEHRMKPGLRKYSCDLGDFRLKSVRDTEKWARLLDDQGFQGFSEGRFYWQVEWTGCVRIGLKYKDRKNVNPSLWCLHCSDDHYHADTRECFMLTVKYSLIPKQLGVYLDCNAGLLSFYEVSSDEMRCCHRFHEHFQQPLYPYVSHIRNWEQLLSSNPGFGAAGGLVVGELALQSESCGFDSQDG